MMNSRAAVTLTSRSPRHLSCELDSFSSAYLTRDRARGNGTSILAHFRDPEYEFGAECTRLDPRC